MEQKRKTSILYQISNIRIEEESVFNFYFIISSFHKGPDEVKKVLVDIWKKQQLAMRNRTDIEVVDIDKEIKPEDFTITYREIPNKAKIYYVQFPECDTSTGDFYGACKCLAYVIEKDIPRFLTMEYSKNQLTNTDCLVFGEWKFNYLVGSFSHLNYGKMERDTIEHFATIVEDKINETK